MSAGVQEDSGIARAQCMGRREQGRVCCLVKRSPARVLGGGLATEPNLRETPDRNDQVKPQSICCSPQLVPPLLNEKKHRNSFSTVSLPLHLASSSFSFLSNGTV